MLEIRGYRQRGVLDEHRSRVYDAVHRAVFAVLDDAGLDVPGCRAAPATDRMHRITQHFVSEFCVEYEVWAHEAVVAVRVNAKEYANEYMRIS